MTEIKNALPRDVILKLNRLEFGWLFGSLSKGTLERMEKEQPIMYLQLVIAFNSAYAFSEGYPLQKQAKKELGQYQKKLKKLLKKENR